MAELQLDQVLRRLGANVRQQRKKRGMTQQGLAEAAEISVRFLQGVELGDHAPSIRTLVAISNALQTPLPKLFHKRTVTRPKPGRPRKRRSRR